MNERFTTHADNHLFVIREHTGVASVVRGTMLNADMARRVTAALNACEGIPTETLEKISVVANLQELQGLGEAAAVKEVQS